MYIPFSERVHTNFFLDRLIPPFFFFPPKQTIFQILFSRNPKYSKALQFLNYMKLVLVFIKVLLRSTPQTYTHRIDPEYSQRIRSRTNPWIPKPWDAQVS